MLSVSHLTVLSGSSQWSSSQGALLAEGARKAGTRVTVASHPVSKHVACWGWRIGRRLYQYGRQVLVMERGYIGDRFAWTSLGWNGLNGRARFYPRQDYSRFDAHFAHLLKPWKDKGDGSYVLLIGQVPGDASLGGLDLGAWYAQSAREAKIQYGLPVVFRPHPVALKKRVRQSVRGAEIREGTLEEQLSGAEIVITFNSNTAVESVLAGVPTIAMDRGSMAYSMCGHKIGERRTPEREDWAARLAWCQWTTDELKSGEAWRGITEQ